MGACVADGSMGQKALHQVNTGVAWCALSVSERLRSLVAEIRASSDNGDVGYYQLCR